MEFMLLFADRKGAPSSMAALGPLARELASQGRLRRAARLAPEREGACVAVRDAGPAVSEGPFAEGPEAVGGFWILEAASREEAVEIARRAFELVPPRPGGRSGAVHVHDVVQRYCVAPDPGQGVPFLLSFCNDPFLVDPDESKLREMIAFGDALERDGKLFETAPLARDGAPPRVESRGGKTLVSEGPFAEAKEVIGGYSLLRAASREEAIEIAKRYPAATWGTVEVREIVELA